MTSKQPVTFHSIPEGLHFITDMFNSSANDWASYYQDLTANLQETMPAPQPPQGPGVFKQGDNFYKVQQSRSSDRLYAKEYNGATFVYTPGAIYRLTEADRLTFEQAAAFGHAHGVCIFCSLTLSDPESAEVGIGPVCEARYFGKDARKARRAAKKAAR